MMDVILTASSVQAFMECQYKYFCEYERRLSPLEEPIYFFWGTLVHKMFEYRRMGFQPKDVIQKMKEDYQSEYTDEMLLKEVYRKKAEQHYSWLEYTLPSVLLTHTMKWSVDDSVWETIQGEQEFELELWRGTDVRYDNMEYRILLRGRSDELRINKHTHNLIIWERKTAAQTGPSYYWALQWDPQPKTYLLAQKLAYAHKVNTVMYDVIKKPQIQRWDRESLDDYSKRIGSYYMSRPESYLERRPIQFSDKDIDEHRNWLVQVGQKLFECRMEGLWTKWHQGVRYPCGFEGICLRGEEDMNLHKYFQVRLPGEINPELSDRNK